MRYATIPDVAHRLGYMDTDGAVEAAVARMREVRNAVGDDVGIGLDFHGEANTSERNE